MEASSKKQTNKKKNNVKEFPKKEVGRSAPPASNIEDWRFLLEKDKLGRNESNAYNLALIFENDPNLKGKFALNLLTLKMEITGKVPWKRLRRSGGNKRELTDYDDSCLRNYLSINYGMKGKDLIHDTLNEVMLNQQHHPIQDYLNNLQWDGKPRIDTLLIDFFDADDTELNRVQTRLALVGAVMRIYEPGSDWQNVLSLKGDQGIGKSTFLQALAKDKEWFSDSLDDIKGKDAKEHLLGKWIIELGEMAAVSKADQKRAKQFISSPVDEFRSAFGRRTQSHPRQCVFFATTNDELPLKDDTGGRRWWIVEVKSKWYDKPFPLEVDQLWAEAVHIYKQMKANGERVKLPSHLEADAKKIQNQNTDRGLFADEIEHILQRGYIERNHYEKGTIKIEVNETCARHVWEEVLGRYKDDLNDAKARQINATLKNLEGWECVGRRQFKEYGKVTLYVRKS